MKSINAPFVRLFSWLFMLGIVSLLSACGGGASDSTPAQAPSLDGIQILVEETNLIAGLQTQAYVVALFSDNSSVDLSDEAQWFSFDSNVASIDANGLITSLQAGSTVISAVVENKTASIPVSVEAGQLLAIDVIPDDTELAAGVQHQFSAEGQYTNGETILHFDITDQVTWSSSNADKVSISNASDNKGLATALESGSVDISATLNGISGSTQALVSNLSLTRIEISARQIAIPAGTQLALQATGIFSDNSQFDLSKQASWQSSNQAIASINAAGMLTAVSVGTVTISANHQGQSATLEISISDAILTNIEISPAQLSLIQGERAQLFATAIYSDGSSLDVTPQATWRSDTTTVASIGNTVANRGEMTAVALGSSVISAHFGGQSQQTTVMVSERSLLSLEITPSNSKIAAGTQLGFSLTGHYDDGTTRDLSNIANWSSNNKSIAKKQDDAGIFKAIAPGSAQITATLEGHSAFTVLTVSTATLTSISLSPTNISIANGFNTQISATGHFSDSSSQDISDSVVWQSSDASVATVSNVADSSGVLSTMAMGSVSISATFLGISQSTGVTVTDAELSSISIQTQINEMNVGTGQILKATGHYSDNSALDISDRVTWSSSNNSVATISNAELDKGRVTALGSGSANISASLGAISNSASLTINNDPNAPVSLSITSTANAILNNGSDSTTITVTLKPADINGSIADNTAINIEINEGGNNSTQIIQTSNGSASFDLSSTYSGVIEIEATVANSDVTGSGYIFTTNTFSNVAVGAELKHTLYEGTTLKAGSWFALIVQNLSSRSFIVNQYQINNGLENEIYPGSEINNGRLNDGDIYVIIVTFENDQTDNGVNSELSLTDESTGEQFSIFKTFTTP